MRAIDRLAVRTDSRVRMPLVFRGVPFVGISHPWRAAFAIVALLALLWQGFLTQTHGLAHLDAPTTPAAHGGSSVPVVGDRHRPETAADCPLCRAIAQAGHYLSPSAPARLLPAPPARAAVRAWPGRPAADTHASRSRIRGPPTTLHA